MYRYWLKRTWDSTLPEICFIMLNPSKADDKRDDPTIKKCLKFAKKWGYGGLVVVNLFAYRSTDPKSLMKTEKPVGDDNDRYIIEMTRDRRVVVAWGTNGKLLKRSQRVLDLLLIQEGRELECLAITKGGHPQHPLFVKDTTTPIPYPTEY